MGTKPHSRMLRTAHGIVHGIAHGIALCGIAALLVGVGADDAAAQTVVNCLDTKRNIVSTTLAANCKGKVISDREAERLKAERGKRLREKLVRRKRRPPVPKGQKMVSTGSAFIVSADGMVLTNYHVIDDCKSVLVELTDGTRHRAKVRDSDPAHDLALLETRVPVRAFARFRAAPGYAGDGRADLVGYPTQGIAPIQPLHTLGRLYQHPRMKRGDARFLIKADVRGGNSGGPVLDEGAAVIGVVYAQVNTAAVLKQRGELLKDIAVAVRNPTVLGFLQKNKVRYETAEPEAALDDAAVFKKARGFVARISCWR